MISCHRLCRALGQWKKVISHKAGEKREERSRFQSAITPLALSCKALHPQKQVLFSRTQPTGKALTKSN